MILVSAENVSPAEVEYLLEARPRSERRPSFAVTDQLTGDAVARALCSTDRCNF